MRSYEHHYIDRYTQQPKCETFAGDWIVYHTYRNADRYSPWLLESLTGKVASRLLATAYFDLPWSPVARNRYVQNYGIDPTEMRKPLEECHTRRDLFTRQLKYETCREMTSNVKTVISPSDSRVLVGNLESDQDFFIKDRFFSMSDLLGGFMTYTAIFHGGDFAIFRLAPDDYHYYHNCVSGVIEDIYKVEGRLASVSPVALGTMKELLSHNLRWVTIIDTDVENGSQVGKVAMIEIAAQVIGGMTQETSTNGYENPKPLERGMFLERGRPKGMFLPGSSTVVVMMERNRVEFVPDLRQQQQRQDVASLYRHGLFGCDMVEVYVQVRDTIAYRKGELPQEQIPIAHGRELYRKSDSDSVWQVRERKRR